MIKITVIKRDDNDFMAYLDEERKKWDFGITPNQAIAQLLRSHKKEMDIEIEEHLDCYYWYPSE